MHMRFRCASVNPLGNTAAHCRTRSLVTLRHAAPPRATLRHARKAFRRAEEYMIRPSKRAMYNATDLGFLALSPHR